MNIKICCDEINEKVNSGDIKFRVDEINIMHYDGEYNDYDKVFSIKYCPFCGKKIEVIDNGVKKDI